MKTKKIIIILLIIISIIGLSIYYSIGYDYFWHIKIGEYIKQNGIPKIGIFSWYATYNNLSFFAHEWLSDLIIYKFYQLFNVYGSFIYSFISISLLIIIIYLTNIKTMLNKSIKHLIPFIILVIMAMSFYIMPRPHLLSYILFSLTLYLSYDLYQHDSKKIYFLPIISILWSNMHGVSSCFVYLVPLLFFIMGLFNFDKIGLTNKRLSKKRLKRYLAIILLSIIALNINPYTYKMLLYPYISVTDTIMFNAINEWQMLKLDTYSGFIIYLLIFYIIYILFKTKNKIKLIDFVLTLIGIIITIKHCCFAPLLIITTFYTITDYFQYDMKIVKNKIITIVLFIIVLLIPTNYHITIETINTKLLSNKLITSIKSTDYNYLYNDYNIGGYLIYQNIDVFIDGRTAIYSQYNLNDYLDITNPSDTKSIIDKYDFDAFVTKNDYYLDTYFKKNNYNLIDKDDNYSFYVKAKK